MGLHPHSPISIRETGIVGSRGIQMCYKGVPMEFQTECVVNERADGYATVTATFLLGPDQQPSVEETENESTD